MKIIDMTCPKCGAQLKMDSDKEKAVCEYCGYSMLIEKEDTLEEIRAKAQSKAYGYHKGKLEAEEEINKKKKYHKARNIVIMIGVIVLIIIVSAAIRELSKPKVNPFDCIEVSCRGKDGEGEVLMDVIKSVEGIDPNLIEFDISKDDHLIQGETISIYATSTEYHLTEKTKVYTVEGLDEYLKDLDSIPEEALEIIHTKATACLELNLESTKKAGAFVEMKPVRLFLATDGKQTNELYDVFEAHFITDSGEKTYYVLARFKDVVIRNGEQVSINMSGGTYLGSLTQIEGSFWIMAYASLEEIQADILTSEESYMELKEKDL